jgi:hypothetical protein
MARPILRRLLKLRKVHESRRNIAWVCDRALDLLTHNRRILCAQAIIRVFTAPTLTCSLFAASSYEGQLCYYQDLKTP